jgi:hypothetical protein
MKSKTASAERSRRTVWRPRALQITGLAILALFIAGGILIAAKWPFKADKVQAELASATSSNVKISGFRVKYFPPGCVIEGLELRQAGKSDGPPLLAARRVTIRANYRGLFFKRIEVMHLEDVHVDMGQRADRTRNSAQPAPETSNSSGSSNNSSDSVAIAELIVDRGVIEFPRRQQPLQFKIDRLSFGNFDRRKPIAFHVTLENPLPPGRLVVDGQFGPWNSSDIAATQLSGSYQFSNANLSSLGGIAGTLSSQGSFAGPAKALRVQGSTDSPKYEVKTVGHPVHLQTQFQAKVDCTNGDVELQSIRGEFERTSFAVAGEVAGKANPHSKLASLQFNDAGGRVEDWLRLLDSDSVPPMTGPISFQARVKVPGGPRPFIRRVWVAGDFELTGVGFTKPESQRDVDKLSIRARGQKVPSEKVMLPPILGTLSGHVELIDGVANFSKLTFTLPGAVADVHGTYSFIDERIDLHGLLRIDTKFSKTSGGPKGLLTRATETLFAKARGDGEILPVKMTGTYDHPSYGLDK